MYLLKKYYEKKTVYERVIFNSCNRVLLYALEYELKIKMHFELFVS